MSPPLWGSLKEERGCSTLLRCETASLLMMAASEATSFNRFVKQIWCNIWLQTFSSSLWRLVTTGRHLWPVDPARQRCPLATDIIRCLWNSTLQPPFLYESTVNSLTGLSHGYSLCRTQHCASKSFFWTTRQARTRQLYMQKTRAWMNGKWKP